MNRAYRELGKDMPITVLIGGPTLDKIASMVSYPGVDDWDILGGLEILDSARERRPLRLCEPADRFHVVVEVEDIEATPNYLIGREALPDPRPGRRCSNVPGMGQAES
jgi:hypothetical protein